MLSDKRKCKVFKFRNPGLLYIIKIILSKPEVILTRNQKHMPLSNVHQEVHLRSQHKVGGLKFKSEHEEKDVSLYTSSAYDSMGT